MLATSLTAALCVVLAQASPPAAAPPPAGPVPPQSVETPPNPGTPAAAESPSPLLNPDFGGSQYQPPPAAAATDETPPSPPLPPEAYPPPVESYPAPAHIAPPPQVQHPPAHRVRPARDPDRSSGIAFLASGLALFGSTYLTSSLIGVASIDLNSTDAGEDARARAYGNRMLIPVIGPWAAIAKSDSATKGWFTGLLGITQGLGVALATVGAIRLSRAHRRRVQNFSVSTGMLPGGGDVRVFFRF